MTRSDKKRFVTMLCNSIRDELKKKIMEGRIPEEWDGLELRELLADKFEHEVFMRRARTPDYRARLREYRNTVNVENL